MTYQNIPFNKKKATTLVLFGVFILAFGSYILLNLETFELTNKLQFLFRNSKNAGLFLTATSLFLLVPGLNRLLRPNKAIVLGPSGFMDHSSIKSPIAWNYVTSAKVSTTEVYGQKLDVLILGLQPGYKSEIDFTLAYRFNNWVKVKDPNFIGIPIHIHGPLGHQTLENLIYNWINHPQIHHANTQRGWRQNPKPYFGQHIR